MWSSRQYLRDSYDVLSSAYRAFWKTERPSLFSDIVLRRFETEGLVGWQYRV